MAKLERSVNAQCIDGVWLDELDPTRGHDLKEHDFSCDFLCQIGGVEKGII